MAKGQGQVMEILNSLTALTVVHHLYIVVIGSSSQSLSPADVQELLNNVRVCQSATYSWHTCTYFSPDVPRVGPAAVSKWVNV